MAGSYNHVVKKDGSLMKADRALRQLDCYHNDAFETIEEMYGMIWYLARDLDNELPHAGPGSIAELVEKARQNYKIGLEISPTPRYKE